MRPHPALNFPYVVHHGIASPIIPLQISGIKIHAYVDSGALISVFSIKEADALGIDYEKGKKNLMRVGSGSLIEVFFHLLPITLGPFRFKAHIGFSPKLGANFNLLGRKDFFNRFVVIFDDTKQTITFIPRLSRSGKKN